MLAKYCETCQKQIHPKRVLAIPDCTQCVACLESAGDVKKIKRHDDHLPSGEIVESYFTEGNQYLKEYINRLTGDKRFMNGITFENG